MRLSRLLTLAGVVYVAAGSGFAFWPYETMRLFFGVDPMSPLLGLDPDPARRMPVWTLFGFTRLYGTALLGSGIVALQLRRTAAPEAQRAVVTGFFLFNLLAAAMTSLQTLAIFSLFGPAGWWLAAALAALAAGFGGLLFGARGVAPAGVSASAGLTLGEVREAWLRELREAAAQEERSRLARELHDSIKQQLFTISVGAAAAEARFDADSAGARSALAEVRQSAREAMAEMEAMLQHLQPVALASVGLVEALRQQCEATRYRTGSDVVLEAPALPAERDLPPGTQAALFRIAQEALSNVARHARARRVTVHLGSANGPWAAELSIADDGAGFDPASIAAGRGLANLRARARELGAELRVDSAPGRGTRIRVRVPMASGSWTSAPATLQRGLLLGLAMLFHLGFAGRPVLGEWVFWSLLPFSTAAGWLGFRLLRAIGRTLAEAGRRLGADGDEVLRLRRQRAQAGFLLVLSACAWNPLFSTVALSYLGYSPAAGIPRLPAAVLTLVIAASLLPLQRALARLRARLSAGAFRDELAAALGESTLPVVLLIGGVGLFGRFLHEWTVGLLPVGLGLWLASLGSWALRSGPAARPDAGTDRP